MVNTHLCMYFFKHEIKVIKNKRKYIKLFQTNKIHLNSYKQCNLEMLVKKLKNFLRVLKININTKKKFFFFPFPTSIILAEGSRMDSKLEKKYLLLKKKLDSLHYCYPLSFDSCDLVDRLLSDLISTSEGYQNLKVQVEKGKEEIYEKETIIQPLRKENGRLNRENNELHYQMMQTKEDCQFKISCFENKVKSLEGEIKDLQFVAEQKDAKIKKLDVEVDQFPLHHFVTFFPLLLK